MADENLENKKLGGRRVSLKLLRMGSSPKVMWGPLSSNHSKKRIPHPTKTGEEAELQLWVEVKKSPTVTASVAQKIKKSSESHETFLKVAKLCNNNSKNRKS